MDDKILEVVAVFGSAQLGISRVINLQHHRIAQVNSRQSNVCEWWGGDLQTPFTQDAKGTTQVMRLTVVHTAFKQHRGICLQICCKLPFAFYVNGTRFQVLTLPKSCVGGEDGCALHFLLMFVGQSDIQTHL